MGQVQSQQRVATPEPEMSPEERAQAQAEVRNVRQSREECVADKLEDACKAASSARQAPCRAAKEAVRGCSGYSSAQEAVGAGADEQGEYWLA